MVVIVPWSTSREKRRRDASVYGTAEYTRKRRGRRLLNCHINECQDRRRDFQIDAAAATGGVTLMPAARIPVICRAVNGSARSPWAPPSCAPVGSMATLLAWIGRGLAIVGLALCR